VGLFLCLFFGKGHERVCGCMFECVCVCVCICVCTSIINPHKRHDSCIQGGKDAEDAISCRSLSAKEPLIMGLFCGKRPIKIRQPMGLCHPVL